jgi:hypothetical protein
MARTIVEAGARVNRMQRIALLYTLFRLTPADDRAQIGRVEEQDRYGEPGPSRPPRRAPLIVELSEWPQH